MSWGMPVAEKHDQNNAIEQQANITSVPIQLEQQKSVLVLSKMGSLEMTTRTSNKCHKMKKRQVIPINSTGRTTDHGTLSWYQEHEERRCTQG
jgi:hypothetical protein